MKASEFIAAITPAGVQFEGHFLALPSERLAGRLVAALECTAVGDDDVVGAVQVWRVG